jgi:hypothetical protein
MLMCHAVETFFLAVIRCGRKRGSFLSIVHLQGVNNHYIAGHDYVHMAQDQGEN